MASRYDLDTVVTQSLIDRLVDREPNLNGDPPISRAQSVRLLKAALRRDLEWLLNTRRVANSSPADFANLGKSVYFYGLPDFSAMSLNSPRDRNSLLRELERSVAYYEPRLKGIRVSLLESPSNTLRVIRFQIEGLLMMDPVPEQISFDTVLQLSSGEYEVKGERNA
jgi:type VI secretion system protein ImpF